MSAIRRSATLALGVLAVAAATLLLMGNLRSVSVGTIQVEEARLQALARLWENRLDQVRSEFRDRLMHSGLLEVLEQPDSWSASRTGLRMETLLRDWNTAAGDARGFAVLYAGGGVHSASGDTTGLAHGLAALRRTDAANMAILSTIRDGDPLLIIQYFIPPAAPDVQPGRALALIGIAGLLQPAANPPHAWTLLAAADRVVLSTATASPPAEINDSTWPLLLGEGAGTLKLTDARTLCFARVQLAGLTPLLLVEPVPVRGAGVRGAAVALLALGVGLLIWNRRPKSINQIDENSEPTRSEEGGQFRQIFQIIDDPLLVVDGSGTILRANRRAQERLRLRRGKPDAQLRIQANDQNYAAADFLAHVAANPATAVGACRVFFQAEAEDRILRITRLYRNEDGDGPLLLHFLPVMPGFKTKEAEQVTESAALTAPQSPYPAIAVTADGIITDCNAAAHRAAPRLTVGQLLSDALPAFDRRDLERFLNTPTDFTIESLLGPTPHEFTAVRCGDGYVLYGHPLADSRKLEIALGQAQESFYALCALSPMPILIVDPHDHLVTDANGAAADLFGTSAIGLRGMPLNMLAEDPWDPANDTIMIARTPHGGLRRCGVRYEMIKVEGLPALLILLDPLAIENYSDLPTPMSHGEAANAEPEAMIEPAAPHFDPGPAILITWDPTVREVARRLLEKAGHACESFTSLDDATVWLISRNLRPEFVAIDLADFDDGESWIGELRERCGDVPCLGFSEGEAYALPGGGLNALLPKPFDLQSVIAALAELNIETSLCLAD